MNEYHKTNVRPLMADNQPLWRCLLWACLNPSSYYRTNPCYRPPFYRPTTLARLIWISTTLRKRSSILVLKWLEIYLKFLIWFGFSFFFFYIHKMNYFSLLWKTTIPFDMKGKMFSYWRSNWVFIVYQRI